MFNRARSQDLQRHSRCDVHHIQGGIWPSELPIPPFRAPPSSEIWADACRPGTPEQGKIDVQAREQTVTASRSVSMSVRQSSMRNGRGPHPKPPSHEWDPHSNHRLQRRPRPLGRGPLLRGRTVPGRTRSPPGWAPANGSTGSGDPLRHNSSALQAAYVPSRLVPFLSSAHEFVDSREAHDAVTDARGRCEPHTLPRAKR